MNLSCQIFIEGFTVLKIARMKNGINWYEKVRIDLGWKPKECLQSYKEFCQSLDIFGVVHVHVCAQHRRAGVSAAVNFFGASTRLRRVSAPKKLTAASTPALLCFAHTCTCISYTKNVSWLAKFFMWLATFFKFHPRRNNVLLHHFGSLCVVRQNIHCDKERIPDHKGRKTMIQITNINLCRVFALEPEWPTGMTFSFRLDQNDI